MASPTSKPPSKPVQARMGVVAGKTYSKYSAGTGGQTKLVQNFLLSYYYMRSRDTCQGVFFIIRQTPAHTS